MTRTPEQKQADGMLTAAVEAVNKAYNVENIRGVLTEYLLIAQRQDWNDDDEAETITYYIPRDNGETMSLSHQLGLVEFAGARLRKAIMADDE